MKLPLIVLATDDRSVELCHSKDYIETVMEPPDVESGLYEVYDSEGIEYPVYVKLERRPQNFLFGLFKVYETRPYVFVDFDNGKDAADKLFEALSYCLMMDFDFEVTDRELPLEELIYLIDQFRRGNR